MSKKMFKILIPFLLAALMVFAAAGCGAKGGNTGSGNAGGGTAGDTSTLDGTYTGDIDMTETISQNSGLDIKTKLAMRFVLTLSSGKDYTMELDTDKFVDDTAAYYETEMPSLIKQSLLNQGLTEEDINTVVKEKGYATFEEYAGAILTEQVDSLRKQFASTPSVVSEGTYKVDGTKISLTDKSSGEAYTIGSIESDGSLDFEITFNGEKTQVVFSK